MGIQADTQQNDLGEQITPTEQTIAAHSYYGVDGYLMHHTIHVQVPYKVNEVYLNTKNNSLKRLSLFSFILIFLKL